MKYNKAKEIGIITAKEIMLFPDYNRFAYNMQVNKFELHLYKIAEMHIEHDGLTHDQKRPFVKRLIAELVKDYVGGINDDRVWDACQVVAQEFF